MTNRYPPEADHKMKHQRLYPACNPTMMARVFPPHTTLDPTLLHKKVHIIRHAEGSHNVNREYRDIKHLDARLTPTGFDQCRRLSTEIASAGWLENASDLLVVTSPLTRCVQTTLTVLEPLLPETVEVVAHESLRETVNYNCDRRRPISEISKEFPRVDFSLVENDHDALWASYVERLGDHEEYQKHRESGELHMVADRGREFFQWLKHRPESHVIVCTHSAFLRCILNFSYGVPHSPEQVLDERVSKVDEPVVVYEGEADFHSSMRTDFANCELRSMFLSFDGLTQSK